MEFGIGSQGKLIGGAFWTATSHIDGIVLNPSVWLDGKLVEKEGEYVHPMLSKLAEELLQT
jgi:leucyl aminopeptidase (aminopeptidase T)